MRSWILLNTPETQGCFRELGTAGRHFQMFDQNIKQREEFAFTAPCQQGATNLLSRGVKAPS